MARAYPRVNHPPELCPTTPLPLLALVAGLQCDVVIPEWCIRQYRSAVSCYMNLYRAPAEPQEEPQQAETVDLTAESPPPSGAVPLSPPVLVPVLVGTLGGEQRS